MGLDDNNTHRNKNCKEFAKITTRIIRIPLKLEVLLILGFWEIGCRVKALDLKSYSVGPVLVANLHCLPTATESPNAPEPQLIP